MYVTLLALKMVAKMKGFESDIPVVYIQDLYGYTVHLSLAVVG